MAYKAVFFDAGETLLSPYPSFHELFSYVLDERGHEVHPDKVSEAFERVAPTFLEVLDRMDSDTWSTSYDVSRKFWGTVYQVAFQELGINDKGEELADALYERFTRYDSYRMFPDAVPTLQRLRESGLTTGLISNFEEWLEGMLHEWEVGPLFDVMLISGKEGVEKPDPQIFERALERARAEPEEAVYVGDHPDIDIAPSEKVGMKGVLIDRKQRHPDYEGTKISNLKELLAIVGL